MESAKLPISQYRRGTTRTFKDGEIQVPQGPGLGIDINEEALERYKV